MLYNNAKAGFVYDLYEKVFANDPESGTIRTHVPMPLTRSTAKRIALPLG